MDLRQLECFLAVSEELHFSRAAQRLHISQPALSQHIKNLEAAVGTPLFDRMGRGTALTEAGEILLAHSQRIFHEMEQARLAINDLHGLERGKLTIGSLLTCVSYLLSPTILKFKELYPNIELSVQGLRAESIQQKLLENKLDLGITYLPVDDADLASVPLFAEELALAVPAAHPLAKARQTTLQALADLTMISLPESYFLRELIDGYVAEAQLTLRPRLEMSPLSALVQMVADGVGVTILPAPYIASLNQPQLRLVPLVNPTPQREIGIVYRKGKFMCATTRTFIDKLTDTSSEVASSAAIKKEAQ